jgi:TPR repeat protein/serine/threonine protein kinase
MIRFRAMVPILSPGAVFAKDFRVESPLSQGGMGAVYIVEQLSTGSRRALKLMHRELVNDPHLRRRFEQEAKVTSRIESDHVVQVVAAGIDEESGMPWLAMELLRGQTLAKAVQQRGALRPSEAAEIFTQLCHALRAAHEAGVVHRDLKPENIFLTEARREGAPIFVKILDFGIARVAAESKSAHTSALGTPLWMAPEQASAGSNIGPKTDIWALGLLGFWLLTGKEYWISASSPDFNPMMAVGEVLTQPLEPASVRAAQLGVADRIPPGFDAWFARAVNRNLEQRAERVNEVRDGYLELLRPLLDQGQPARPSLASMSDARPHSTPHATPVSLPPSGPAGTVVASQPFRQSTPPHLNTPSDPGPSPSYPQGGYTPVSATPVSATPARPTPPHGSGETQLGPAGWAPPIAPTPANRASWPTPPSISAPVMSPSSRSGPAAKPSNTPLYLAIGATVVVGLGLAGWGATKLKHQSAVTDCANKALPGEARLSACKSACDPLVGGAPCLSLGDLLVKTGDANDTKAAVDIYESMCERDELDGCERVGDVFGKPLGAGKRDEKKAVEYWKHACDGGLQSGCRRLGVANDIGWDTGGPTQAASFYEKACKEGEDVACVYLASALASSRGGLRDEPRARDLFKNAVAPLEADCGEGSADACAALGLAHEMGAPPDLGKAAAAYQKACDAGDLLGCNNLGTLLKAQSAESAAEPARGMALFQQACDRGEAAACNNVGAVFSGHKTVLRRGARGAATFRLACGGALSVGCAGWGDQRVPWPGGPKDLTRATSFFEKACDAGALVACVNLGGLMFIGQGAEKDRPKAHQLFNKACDGGEPSGCGESGSLHMRDYAEAASNYGKGAELLKKGCEGGEQDACATYYEAVATGMGVGKDADTAFATMKGICDSGKVPFACSLVGDFYMNGTGTARDFEKAQKLLTTSCDGGYGGCINLAGMFFRGDGVTADAAAAFKILQKGCDAAEMPACFQLGICHNEGIGTPKDHTRAAELFRHACGLGHAESCNALARAYLKGEGVPKDDQKGISLARDACGDGYMGACATYGMTISRGLGEPANPEKARPILKKACDKGVEPACQELATLK